MESPRNLTFSIVDDLAFAATCNPEFNDREPLSLQELGPFVEFAILGEQGRLGDLVSREFGQRSFLWLMLPSRSRHQVVELGRNAGFIRLANSNIPETEFTKFLIVCKGAARAAGFGERPAGQLAAAAGELLSNIVEHSQACGTGLAAYQAVNGTFEFVVADQGIGALASLRSNDNFANLASHRDALPLVLRHGFSRHRDPGRGCGFDDLFRGLANHNGNLRFTSGDAAVLIDGRSPTAIRPKVKKKPYLQGFLASVSCSP